MSQPSIKAAMREKIPPERRSEISKKMHARFPNMAKESSERMTVRNPMSMDGVREKVCATLQKIGHKPSVRRGNGTGPTMAEKIVHDMFPESIVNFAVKTGGGIGYPNHYKVDVAWPHLKMGLEMDGYSHSALIRQAQDRKKEAKLFSLGWVIMRVKNQYAFDHPEELRVQIQELLSSISKSQTIQATLF
jgi:very-short-patch-repair endonuclease